MAVGKGIRRKSREAVEKLWGHCLRNRYLSEQWKRC
jgi:hypothetical protein